MRYNQKANEASHFKAISFLCVMLCFTQAASTQAFAQATIEQEEVTPDDFSSTSTAIYSNTSWKDNYSSEKDIYSSTKEKYSSTREYDLAEVTSTPQRVTGDKEFCMDKPCGQNATCTNTSNDRYCRCKCGYVGNPEKECSLVDPQTIIQVECGIKLPISIPISTKETDDNYQKAAVFVENFFQESLKAVGSFINESVRVRNISYAYQNLCW